VSGQQHVADLGRTAASIDRRVGLSEIATLEQLLRDKDDMLAAQFRELTECRRHLAMAQEGITHWRARALAAEDQP
jgi:hypothetical protein